MQKTSIWGSVHPFFEDGPVLGRKMANASFLTALLEKDPFDAYHFFIASPRAQSFLEQHLANNFPDMWKEKRLSVFNRQSLTRALKCTEYFCFHLSDWVEAYPALTMARNVFSKALFPITAPLHTLSYARYGSAFLRHLWPGVSPRDAIVATSRATEQVIDGYFSQLERGYGLSPEHFPRPKIHRIPLGVEPTLFAGKEEKKRLGAGIRQELGISPDTCIFLSFSRVSYLSKMDFLPILDAFHRAEKKGLGKGKYHFILAGRMDANDPFGEAIVRLAAEQGIPFTLLPFPDNPDNERRKALFAAADVFISAVDNIQETFGLTILEAYAASLPVVATAIDGYKELVRPGETGFLIPSIGPSSAAATQIEASFLQDDLYHLYLAQQTVVELAPFAGFLARLGGDKELREKMGKAGKAMAEREYAWSGLTDRYIRLWRELADTVIAPEKERAIRTAAHPSHPAFLSIFKDYFSAMAGNAAVMERTVALSEKGRAHLHGGHPLVIYRLVRDKLDKNNLNAMLRAAEKPCSFRELAHEFAGSAGEDCDFLILWALKHDLLEFR